MTTFREALLGRSYQHHRRLIERSRAWSPAQINSYQQDRLQRLIHRYGDSLTNKEDYRQNLRRYTRWNMPLLTHPVRTGGSSGEPLRFQVDTPARQQKELAYIFDIWSEIGYAPFDLRVIYRGNVHDDLHRFEWLQNRWIVSVSSTTEDRLDDLRRWARQLPPFFLHAYPSSLYTFIDLLGEKLFRALPVRGILAGSESLPVGEQEKFEREFGVRVAHWYGHSEYAVLAYRCGSCGGFHFYPTYGYVELLGSPEDQLRRIVASSFNRIGTQFVRYDTGDLAAAPYRICGDQFAAVGEIFGRSQETFVDGAGRKRALGSYVFGIHGPFWDQVRDLQFVQERAGAMLVKLVTSPGADRAELERTLARRLLMVRLEFEYVDRIERRPNSKRAYFVSNG